MVYVSRRGALVGIATTLTFPVTDKIALAKPSDLSREMILNDPAAPVSGNPKGDLTVVAFLDYNCPYCKKTAPDLDRVVKEDGKIRLVYKDWPVIFLTSIDGAKLALAAKYQRQYDKAHHALMSIPGSRVEPRLMRTKLQNAGIDMKRLDADLKAHASDIDTLIKRNMAQADGLGLQGTPTFLVGPFMASTLDYKGFKQVVSDARAQQAKEK